MKPLQVGAIGVDIQVHITEDGTDVSIASSSARTIFLKHPTLGITKSFSGALVGGGTTGRMKYTTTAAADLPDPGDWWIQGRYVNSAGTYYTEWGILQVAPNLN